MALVVTELHVYPVKSFAGISLRAAGVGLRGIHRDRQWMVVDQQMRHVSQREAPTMALARVTEEASGALRLDAPSMPPILIDDDTCRTPAKVTVFGHSCDALLAGGEARDWVSTYLGQPVDLAYCPAAAIRPVDPRYASPGDEVAFADGFPILVATEASLQDLNNRLETPVPMNRFRPNVVLSGSLPWEEDDWKTLHFPGLQLRVVKSCERCSITTVDQRSAEKGAEPLRALAKFRRRGEAVWFAQNAIPDAPGTVSLGDVAVAH